VIGRGEEIEQVIQIPQTEDQNNPALIGEPGVGKMAIAEPHPLDHRRRRPDIR
jgi:ATP-dependent Clp protease ATP-binding subunit ClpA